MPFSLNDHQIAQYRQQGFLLVRASEHDLVSGTKLQEWASQVHSWPKDKGKWMPYDEINVKGERQLMRTERFVDYHPEFDSLLRGKNLLGLLGQLSGAVSVQDCNLPTPLTLQNRIADVTASRCFYSKTRSIINPQGRSHICSLIHSSMLMTRTQRKWFQGPSRRSSI